MASIRRVRTVHTGVAGSPYYTNMYFLDGPNGPQDYIDVVTGFWSNLEPDLTEEMIGVVEAEVPTIDEVTGNILSIESGVAVNVQGTSPGDLLPPTVQGLARWTTGQYRNGRQVRGRTFIPGLHVDTSEFGRPSVAFRGRLQVSIDYLVGLTAIQHVVWSKTNGVALITSGGSAWAEFASLRSRRD